MDPRKVGITKWGSYGVFEREAVSQILETLL
jgi:hypothetical protein